MKKISKKVSKKISMCIRFGIITIGLVLGCKIGLGNTQAMRLVTDEVSTNEGETRLKRISSYDELIKIFKDRGIIVNEDARILNNIVYEDGIAQAAAFKSSEDASDYSTTNVQVDGVDEADVMKNDRRYIYQLVNQNKIAIIDTKDKLKVVSTITNSREIYYKQMLLDGDKLIVFGLYASHKDEMFTGESKVGAYKPGGYKPFSVLQIYDIKDRSNPKLIRQIGIEGNLQTIRKINNTVYMITNKWLYSVYEGQFDKEDIIPWYIDSLKIEDTKSMDINNIWYEPWTNESCMTFITAVQVDENKPITVQALLGDTSTIYMNQNALYLTRGAATYWGIANTYINKFTVDKQNISYAATGKVKGTLLNQFSMDEYNGNFRIAVTNNINHSNAVYILDTNLKQIGSLEGLAPGERIYSVRFDGEKGYVVTFKQVDPLFVIDLKDPKLPKVLGELKIPGYSQYLHPIGTNLVVGIGRATSEIIRRDEQGKEVVTGVVNEGIKLSLFDVKDPTNPKEINNIILGIAGSDSEALSNHKAVTVHSKRQLLAIPIYIQYDEQSSLENFDGAYIFGVENGKLVGKAKLGRIDNTGSMYDTYYSRYNKRVCYIGDKFYFLYNTMNGYNINEYELDTYKRTQTITLD